jgi:hypothetical protein
LKSIRSTKLAAGRVSLEAQFDYLTAVNWIATRAVSPANDILMSKLLPEQLWFRAPAGFKSSRALLLASSSALSLVAIAQGAADGRSL